MFLFEDLWPLDHAVAKSRLFSEPLLQSVREFTTNPSCESGDSEMCRDESTAFVLKFVAMASILVAGFGGIAIPLLGKQRRFLRSDGMVLAAAKAFAAGVILATGFVHMLKDSWEALNHPCLQSHTWSKFPFTGFFAMMSALLTLLVDFVATQYYERKQGLARGGAERGKVVDVVEDLEEELLGSGIVEVKEDGKVFGEEACGGMHIVGMHAHAAQHRHSHSCHDGVKEPQHGHSHSHSFEDDGGSSVRHVVVSQRSMTSRKAGRRVGQEGQTTKRARMLAGQGAGRLADQEGWKQANKEGWKTSWQGGCKASRTRGGGRRAGQKLLLVTLAT